MVKEHFIKGILTKREKILLAAAKVFSENGFYNSTVTKIAKKAGVADGTIYIYFKNKDDILIQLFEESMKIIISTLTERLEKTDNPSEKLKIYINHHFELANDFPELAEVIQIELRQSAKFMKEYKNVPFLSFINIVRDIVIQGQEKGIFNKNLNPDIAKRVVFGTLDEIALHWILKGRSYDLLPVAEELHYMFLNGILKK